MYTYTCVCTLILYFSKLGLVFFHNEAERNGEFYEQTGKNGPEMGHTERFIMEEAAANQKECSRASNSPSGQVKGQLRLKWGKASSGLNRK